MKRLLLAVSLGVIVGSIAVGAPAIYELRKAVEEKNTAVVMATNLMQSEPAAIEAACHQREVTATTAAIAELTSQFKPAPAPAAAAPPPQADSMLMGLLRFILH